MDTIEYALLFFAFFIAGCASPAALGDKEKEKLDPPLQQLLEGKQTAERKLNVIQNSDGTKLYGVIIRIKDNVTEKELGIHCNTLQSGIATARLTLEEIREIVKLDAVIRVEAGTKSYINH